MMSIAIVIAVMVAAIAAINVIPSEMRLRRQQRIWDEERRERLAKVDPYIAKLLEVGPETVGPTSMYKVVVNTDTIPELRDILFDRARFSLLFEATVSLHADKLGHHYDTPGRISYSIKEDDDQSDHIALVLEWEEIRSQPA